MADNSVKDLREFFFTKDNPGSSSEMREFWQSLSEEEKDYYKSVDLD